MDLQNRNDYTIILGVRERELATPVIKSLHPLQTHIIIGKDYPSFSKLVNDCIVMCPTEIVIFCSHRVRPTPSDITRLLERIDAGHGLATLYRLGCFGFKKELIRRIGFFDERYLLGGWEDNDFFIRLKEADISYYEDESIDYKKGESLWKREDKEFLDSEIHYYNKWYKDVMHKTLQRLLPEETKYDIGEKDSTVQFKKWNESHLIYFTEWLDKFSFKTENKELVSKKRLLVFGGTGSLGYKVVEMLGSDNEIFVYSRDENKQWHMMLEHGHVNYIIGDVRDVKRVESSIIETNPDVIIIASALKHVDRCEFEVDETYSTNCLGVINVLDAVKKNLTQLSLSHVVFISTDKACSPVNTYGLTKALAEKAVIEAAYKIEKMCHLNENNQKVKLSVVRYGNVLNSRGSIIEVLNKKGNDKGNFRITHPDMTRFIMTQEDAVNLINYAIQNGETGDIIIPKLRSMKIRDLIEIFSVKFNKKEIDIAGLRPGEKLHEALINETETHRVIETENYFIIKPLFNHTYNKAKVFKYDSSIPIIDLQSLTLYLKDKRLI